MWRLKRGFQWDVPRNWVWGGFQGGHLMALQNLSRVPVQFKNTYSYGPLPVISTYNPIYNMYNPTEITSYNE